MLRGIYTAASGMLADQRRLDVIANNLANASTLGYKRDTSITQAFNDFFVIRRNDEDPGKTQESTLVGLLSFGSLISHTASRLTTGALRATGNPLDVAITGDGFFTVSTPQGLRYTRQGSFAQDGADRLVTESGLPVMVDGHEVAGPPGSLTITRNGEVKSGDQVLGKLSVTSTARLGSIRKEGTGLWVPVSPGEPSALVTPAEANGVYDLKVGYLESANVEPVTEMVEMMTTVRSYEANQKAIQAMDETLQKAVTEVGRIG